MFKLDQNKSNSVQRARKDRYYKSNARTTELLLSSKASSIRFTDASDQVPAARRGVRKTDIARPLSDHIEVFKPRQCSAPPLSPKNV